MPAPIDKEVLRDQLLAALEAALAAARQAHDSAMEGAFHEEAKAENDKDTRGLEQSYLARGVAQRVADLEAAVALVAKWKLATTAVIALGAVVTVHEETTQHQYFIAPAGGGTMLDGIQVITLASPLGRALLGKREGDEIDLPLGGRARSLEVVEVK